MKLQGTGMISSHLRNFLQSTKIINLSKLFIVHWILSVEICTYVGRKDITQVSFQLLKKKSVMKPPFSGAQVPLYIFYFPISLSQKAQLQSAVLRVVCTVAAQGPYDSDMVIFSLFLKFQELSGFQVRKRNCLLCLTHNWQLD